MSRELNRYFDNAATSFPKPKEVAEELYTYINEIGGTYGRAAYDKVQKSTLLIEQCRDSVLEILNAPKGYLVWTSNATDAINITLQSLKGSLKRVLISPLEHNAVMRVLVGLEIPYDIMPGNQNGEIDIRELSNIDLTGYSLAIVNHQSNVNGVIQPIEQIKKIIGELPLLVDAAQSLGERELFVEKWNIDYVVFTGHKGLFGPTGIGGFYAKDISTISPTRFGGTGSRSESIEMPDIYPDKFQYGTPNTVGIVGLYHAINNAPTPQHSFEDFTNLLQKVSQIDGIKLYCSSHYENPNKQGELFAITHNRIEVSEFAQQLWEQHNIAVRSGLHCAPMAHTTLGSSTGGSVRFSLSAYHNKEDIENLYNAIKTVSNLDMVNYK